MRVNKLANRMTRQTTWCWAVAANCRNVRFLLATIRVSRVHSFGFLSEFLLTKYYCVVAQCDTGFPVILWDRTRLMVDWASLSSNGSQRRLFDGQPSVGQNILANLWTRREHVQAFRSTLIYIVQINLPKLFLYNREHTYTHVHARTHAYAHTYTQGMIIVWWRLQRIETGRMGEKRKTKLARKRNRSNEQYLLSWKRQTEKKTFHHHNHHLQKKLRWGGTSKGKQRGETNSSTNGPNQIKRVIANRNGYWLRSGYANESEETAPFRRIQHGGSRNFFQKKIAAVKTNEIHEMYIFKKNQTGDGWWVKSDSNSQSAGGTRTVHGAETFRNRRNGSFFLLRFF